MSWLIVVRLAKLLSVAVMVGGAIATLLPRNLADRRRAAYLVFGPAFGGVWVFGMLLVSLSGRSFLEPFVIGGLSLSFVSLQGVLYVAGRDGRRTWKTAAVVLVPLLVAFAWMVLRV